MELGKIIREIRLARRKSIRQIAQDIGIQFSALHRFEQGKPLDQSNLQKILLWLFK